MVLFPSRDSAKDADTIIKVSLAFGVIAIVMIGLAFVMPDGARLFSVAICALFMAIALCGIGMFLDFHGRMFGLRYGALGHDDLRDIIPGMISQTFAGLTILMGPAAAIVMAANTPSL
tara:strand:+ start:52 stop:405 length:354 start_codon:yes stop_codon:yes gene_type:complete